MATEESGVASVESALVQVRDDATVLVVDDTPANVALLKRVLDGAGIARVHGFTDPRRALAHCAEHLPDLVLLDLHMPDLDGFAVMESLKRMVPTDGFLPVLVLTADANAAVKERALAAGAKDFLTKPFDRTEVLLRVANLLETRALYRRLEQQNVDLRSTVEAHQAAERAATLELQRRRERVAQAFMPEALTMVFQPVVDLHTCEVVGAEALARFSCEPRRPPDKWFAEAEQTGRGAELELAAVAAALEHLADLPPKAFLAINVSPATGVSSELERLLSGYPGELVVLELTEHTRVVDYDVLLAALEPLRKRGVGIAVDDTGSGYAGLHHLLQIRPAVVKLDTALTRGIDTDPVRRSLAAALVTFAAETGVTIIAEGIETAGELATLRRIGISWGQGYHLARPGPLPLTHSP
jgi:EAL domain-containing protein (putative c-di-GMP-specific phosphodiesterase class I)